MDGLAARHPGAQRDGKPDDSVMAQQDHIQVADLWCEVGRGRLAPRAKLPSWARFMACAGHLLGSAEERVTLGVTVPVRGFSAAFAAAAAVVCRDELEPMSPSDLDAHIARLREAPVGAPVKFHTPARILDGRWLGIDSSRGTEML